MYNAVEYGYFVETNFSVIIWSVEIFIYYKYIRVLMQHVLFTKRWSEFGLRYYVEYC